MGKETLTVVLLSLILVLVSTKGEGRKKNHILKLRDAIELGIKNFEKIKSAQINVEILENKLFQAKLSPFTKYYIESYITPTPERHGNAIYSAQSDTYFGGEWGIITGVNFKGGIPINISRLWFLWQLLKSSIEVEKLKTELEKLNLTMNIVKAYWGLYFTYKLKNLLSQAKDHLEKGENYIKEELEKESSNVTEIDQIRLRVYKEEIEAKEVELTSTISVLKETLRFFTGIKGEFELPEDTQEENLILKSLKEHIEDGINKRVELKIIKLTESIINSEEKMIKAGFFPELLLGITAGYGYCDVIDDQPNPFVNDPYNYKSVGFGLILRWDLDFTSRLTELKENRLKQKKLNLEGELLKRAIMTEIVTSYNKVNASKEKVLRYEKARRYARGWVMAVMQNIEAGVGEIKELVDALKAYFEESLNYYNSLYQLKLDILQFQIATGEEIIQ